MEIFFLVSSISLIHLMGVMSPGPDLIMVIKNSLTYSRKTGIWTTIGIAFGVLIHITYCTFGLAAVISQSILAFTLLKMLGATYLIFIGWKSLFSRSSRIEIQNQTKKEDISPFRAFKIGFLTNLLNPKATLYFLGLFTLVLSPEMPREILFLLSVIMFVITILWFSGVAFFLTIPKIYSTFESMQTTLNKIFGLALIAFGIKIALLKK